MSKVIKNKEEAIKWLQENTTVAQWGQSELMPGWGTSNHPGERPKYFATLDGKFIQVSFSDVWPAAPGTPQSVAPGSVAPHSVTAQILQQAMDAQVDRAASRDVGNERSMTATVAAFNAMYGKDLTVEEGWMFQVFLKASRAKGGDFREDDYVDGAGYFALAGEEAKQSRGGK